MKTNKIAAIVSVLALAASSSLWASPPSKLNKGPHRHEGVQGAPRTVERHTVLERVGPPGKGHAWIRAYNR